MDDAATLAATIAALEAQRAVLGDVVVDTALGPLLERRARQQAAAGIEQRKLVTVVFSDLVDFTVLSQALDAEDVRAIVHRYFQRWYQTIEAHGGTVEKFIGDAVMAVFGLYQAREDDPHRAVRAAVAMTAELASLNLELQAEYGRTLAMRVGVDTGEVVVSTLDERPGADFVVVGETVNRAARLQAAAPPGGVLISADTFRHVRGSFALERRAGLQLKGIDTPVDAYLVLAEGSRSFWPERRAVEGVATRTVGRDLELRRLQDWFAEVVEDQAWRTVTVVGEAGVGKSRLLFELDRWLAELPEGVWVLRGRASPAGAMSAYGLLREVFANRFEIHDSDPPARVAEKWTAGMAGAGAEQALQVAAWLGFEVGDGALPHDPQGRSERGAELLAAHLAGLTEVAPLVLELEDLHWADDASLEWLERAARRLAGAPVLVVATARPSLLEARPHWGEGLAHHGRLPLEPLSRRRSLHLLEEILQRVEAVPESLADLVVTQAEGNPFYTEELVKWLVELGLIRTGDRWSVADDALDALRVPPTLKGLLQARLDALAPADHAVVQRAAVVGRTFWDGAVAAAGDLDPAACAQALERLRTREVVYRREQSAFAGTQEYVFKHALLRDVAYDSVLRRRRARDHAQVARWLAEVTDRSGRAEEYAASIGHHHEQAGEAALASAWYVRAGRHAASLYANAEAIDLLSRALAVAPAGEHRVRFDALLEREAVHDRLGERDAQAEDLDAMAAELEGRDDPRGQALLLLARARWSFVHSRYDEQSGHASEAAALARAAGLAEVETDAVLWWGKGLAWAYQHDHARRVLDQALGLARRTGLRSAESETLRYLAIVANNQGRLAEAEQLLAQALELRRLDHDVEGEGNVLGQLGTVLHNQGRFDEAFDALTRAREIFVRSGHKYRESICVGNLGAIATEQGQLGRARQLARDGLRLAGELDDLEGQGTAHAMLSEVARYAGADAEARDHLEHGLRIAREIGYDYLAASALFTIALLDAADGRHGEAEAAALEGIDVARRSGSPLLVAKGGVVHGLVLLRAGRAAPALDAFGESLAEPATEEVPTLRREATAGVAAAQLRLGRPALGAELLGEVLPWLDARGVEGTTDPAQVFASCLEVLEAAGDPRAGEVRQASLAYLAEMVERIEDPELVEGYLGPGAPAAELVALTGFAR